MLKPILYNISTIALPICKEQLVSENNTHNQAPQIFNNVKDCKSLTILLVSSIGGKVEELSNCPIVQMSNW